MSAMSKASKEALRERESKSKKYVAMKFVFMSGCPEQPQFLQRSSVLPSRLGNSKAQIASCTREIGIEQLKMRIEC